MIEEAGENKKECDAEITGNALNQSRVVRDDNEYGHGSQSVERREMLSASDGRCHRSSPIATTRRLLLDENCSIDVSQLHARHGNSARSISMQ